MVALIIIPIIFTIAQWLQVWTALKCTRRMQETVANQWHNSKHTWTNGNHTQTVAPCRYTTHHPSSVVKNRRNSSTQLLWRENVGCCSCVLTWLLFCCHSDFWWCVHKHLYIEEWDILTMANAWTFSADLHTVLRAEPSKLAASIWSRPASTQNSRRST